VALPEFGRKCEWEIAHLGNTVLFTGYLHDVSHYGGPQPHTDISIGGVGRVLTRRRFLQGLVLLPLGGLLAKHTKKPESTQTMDITGVWGDGSRKKFVFAQNEMCFLNSGCLCAYGGTAIDHMWIDEAAVLTNRDWEALVQYFGPATSRGG